MKTKVITFAIVNAVIAALVLFGSTAVVACTVSLCGYLGFVYALYALLFK